jgi:hypothetical protein
MMDLLFLLVGIVSNVLRMVPEVLAEGQLVARAAGRILAVLANISRALPSFQVGHHHDVPVL